MRGKHRIAHEKIRRLRITPAGAGKTTEPSGLPTVDSDHPRRCGENRVSRSLRSRFAGSPPQVRGKLTGGTNFVRANRITPAGAGKTPTRSAGLSLKQDHPRRCGENADRRIVELAEAGSPPQVRGKLSMVGFLLNLKRITPAGAGKTSVDVAATMYLTDHPRRCGENTKKIL